MSAGNSVPEELAEKPENRIKRNVCTAWHSTTTSRESVD